MDKKVNFGVTGIAGSGKDTLTAMLLDELHKRGYNEYYQYSFALPLKIFAKDVFGFSDYDVFDQEGKEKPFAQVYSLPSFKERFKRALSGLTAVNLENKEYFEDLWFCFRDVMIDQIPANPIANALAGWNDPEKAIICFSSTPRIILQLLGTEFFRQSISESFWTDISPDQNVIISDMRFNNELEHILAIGGVPIGVIGRDSNTTASSGHSSENVGPIIARCKHIVSNTGTLEDLRAKAVEIIDVEMGK